MALASESDPVEATRLMVDDMAAGDFAAGTLPNNIEKVEATTRRIKEQRSGDDIYVHQPTDGELSQFAADASYTEGEVVEIQCWTTDSSARAFERMKDIRDYIQSNFMHDNGSSTDWHRVLPTGRPEYRHQSQAPRRGDHYIAGLLVELRQLR